MPKSRLARRLAAFGLLVAAMSAVVLTASSSIVAFVEGQRDIDAKQAQLRGLRDLAAARAAFDRLLPKGAAPALILPADADAAAALQNAVTRAADGQQVIVDGVDPLPPEPAVHLAAVHLRATQAGLYGFLKAVEEQTPYLLVPRLELTPSRSADPEHGKPFVLSADLRLAMVTAPPMPTRKSAQPADAATP